MADRLRAVLVGCGAMSRGWLKAIQGLADAPEIVGLVDLVEGNARLRKDEFELESAVLGTDFEDMLDRTKPDVVFDCTVPEAHHPVGMAALQRGCHVLVEKPLADSMERARELVRTAQAEDRLLAVIQNRRYESKARRLRRLIAGGQLGEITTTHVDFFIGAHFGGFREHMRHVLLIDMAIHTFDVARFFTGTDPVAVYCKEWNPQGSWYDHDASAVCIFEMTDGVVFTYRGSWASEGCHTTWEADWRFIGTEGSAVWDGADHFQAERVAAREGFNYPKETVALPEPAPEDRVGGHQGLIADFLDCVRTGRTPETAAADNIKSLAMCFAAAESGETGRRVEVEF